MTAPAAMTYDSLVDDIQVYAERYDDPFVEQIPRFIMLCENRIATETKPLGLLSVVTGTITTNTLAKPIRWRQTKSFSILVSTERKYLFDRSYEYCRTYAPTSGSTGVPRFYADYDYEHFFIAPTPAISYDFELAYYERPEPLSTDQQTSWTTIYAPQLLLYGSLMEAMPFLKWGERIPEFQGLYDRAMSSILREDAERTTDASADRGKK